MKRSAYFLSLSLATAAAGATLAHTSDAEACGGTFCDQGPPVDPGQPPLPPMPVDQTGETVIFAVDGDMIEAHIQIEFDPESGAERFAWLIPLPSVPEFGVSSDAFFDAMQLATVPVFGYGSSVAGSCGGGGGGSSSSGGPSCESEAEATTGSASSDDEGEDDGGQNGEPEVVQHGFAGAFEYYVLDGGTVEGVYGWLEDNAFDTNPDAEPMIADYLAEGHVFVAVKLAVGEGSSAIHPIKLRFAGDEFCVPLRLTSIAAVEDMAVRVMVLAEDRAAPANWAHVVPNPMAFDWVDVGANYNEVITLALDEGLAEGHAWVTEYSGSSAIVGREGLWNPLWNLDGFDAVTPETLVEVLQSQEIIGECVDEGCPGGHELGESVLASFLPVPDALTPGEFYNCVECFVGLVDLTDFDPAAIRAMVNERIVAPGAHAVELLNTRPTLTRMLTRISPHEMTEDPIFLTNADLEDVDLPEAAERRTDCNSNTRFSVDYFTELSFLMWDPNAWPEWEAMPNALRVELIGAAGAPQVIEDNYDTIVQQLSLGGQVQASSARSHDVCEGDGDGGWSDTSDDGHPSAAEGRGGCACNADDDELPPALSGLLLLGAVALRRRRRGRAS